MKKKLLKYVNRKVPKNKIVQKKHISNFNTNLKQNKNNINTNRKKNILTKNEDENIGTQGQHEIQDQEIQGM